MNTKFYTWANNNSFIETTMSVRKRVLYVYFGESSLYSGILVSSLSATNYLVQTLLPPIPNDMGLHLRPSFPKIQPQQYIFFMMSFLTSIRRLMSMPYQAHELFPNRKSPMTSMQLKLNRNSKVPFTTRAFSILSKYFRQHNNT